MRASRTQGAPDSPATPAMFLYCAVGTAHNSFLLPCSKSHQISLINRSSSQILPGIMQCVCLILRAGIYFFGSSQSGFSSTSEPEEKAAQQIALLRAWHWGGLGASNDRSFTLRLPLLSTASRSSAVLRNFIGSLTQEAIKPQRLKCTDRPVELCMIHHVICIVHIDIAKNESFNAVL